MILIINTSGKDLEFVMGDKYKSVAVEKQSTALPSECEKFINECGATWRDISAIGIIVGPGSFTGIRLGIAYAKGIGMGLNIPVVGISMFDLYLADTYLANMLYVPEYLCCMNTF
jgi:tRNA threonylcarbamoyl adenosine modification protein YeaZ